MKPPPTPDQLLVLADRGERKRLTGEEARRLRDGIRALTDQQQGQTATITTLQARIRHLDQQIRDTERALTLAEPHRIPCPRCGAEAGQPCRPLFGRQPPATPHVARLDNARKDRP
jgi:hypothetical protein